MDVDVVRELYGRGHLIEPDALDFTKANSEKIMHNIAKLDPGRDSVLTLSKLREVAGDTHGDYKILFSYDESFELKGGVEDFLSYFLSRYQKISNFLRNRPELDGVVSINKTRASEREKASLIGIVKEVSATKSGHYLVELEDQTGEVRVLIPKGSECHKLAEEIVYDEVVGLSGRTSKELFFAQDVIFPEVPQVEWPVQSFSTVLISDTHVGSNTFLESAFHNFISWLNGEWGAPQQRALAATVKFVLIAGDLVDGCGVYKGQLKELSIPDIQEQYGRFSQLIADIPSHITVIISPGNHDATREAEPQPPIPTLFASRLHELGNVVMVSNPAYIMLGDVVVLMYHGSSLDSLINAIPSLRKDGYDHPEKAMQLILRKRHLCPIYGESTRIFPETEDSLVIHKVPHILHMGHVHSFGAAVHRGVRIINSGTFQEQTPFQAKIGHHPTPGIVPIIDGAGNIKVIDFKEQDQEPGSS